MLGPDAYSIHQVICRDLTGDGVKEMTVLLLCCTTAAASPWAIFEEKHGRWRPAFRRAPPIDDIGLRGRAIVERLPVYRYGDALCCSSFTKRITVRWNGSRFAVHRGSLVRVRMGD